LLRGFLFPLRKKRLPCQLNEFTGQQHRVGAKRLSAISVIIHTVCIQATL
jgi:hypothetical protein